MVKNNGSISSTKYKSDGATNLNKQTSSIKLTKDTRCIDKCNAEYLMQITLIPCMNKRIFRWIIIFLFICSLIGSIYVIPEINTVSDATKLVPDDSYVLDFIDEINEIYTGTIVDELQIVVQDQDFSNAEVRNNIRAMMRDMENQTESLSNVDNWLESFELWYLNRTNQSLNVFENDPSGFYEQLQIYADPTSVYHYEITYDDIDNPTKITHTRFTMRVIKSASVTGQWPQYLAWNSIMDDYLPKESEGFAFIPEYCFAYLSQSIVGLTVDNMVFAGIGVFGVLVLLLDLRLALFIMMIVAMIDVNLFGWMWLLDISLDTLSYSQCVMAVGLTVDYVIHITHAIAEAKPEFDINYDMDSHNEIYHEKLKIALSEMGASVVKGAFTTFIGALALIFSQSQAFRIFFYMFSGIITIAVAHGIILTPAIMGEIRFIYAGIDDEEGDHGTSTKVTKPTSTLANLTLAQSVGNSNASDFADREDYASPSPRHPSSNAKKELSPIMAHGAQLSGHTENGIVDNGPRTPIEDEKKRKSIQMTNYNDDDSNESSKDPFEE